MIFSTYHLLHECDKLVHFWTSVKAWISIETDTNINFSTEIILGTPSDIPPIFDLYLTIAKMHIYCCKFQNIAPGIDGFAKGIADIKHIEKYIAVKKEQNTSIQSKMVNIRPNCSFKKVILKRCIKIQYYTSNYVYHVYSWNKNY